MGFHMMNRLPTPIFDPPGRNGYPSNWQQIATCVKSAAGWKCVRCGHDHDPALGYTLTVHHIDGVKANCEPWNLAALCQRCHLRIQGRVRVAQGFLFPELHSTWIRPFLIGRWKATGDAMLKGIANDEAEERRPDRRDH